ncbi:dihydropyrimidinase [Elioraea rosea]|uniref:dihydropyrimidinase n=1 Tax=Elioraea rosea TaxID=2492390 RepID=UPI00118391E3|nr:dihydropyrimidinase [Elioraea rosea]
MSDHDLVVRGGTIVTASDTMRADIGVRGGRIVAIAESLPASGRSIEAEGLLVMPGGVDTHCHIEQLEANGTVHEDSFATASASAFAGGTTSAICFASQFKGHPIGPTLDEYRRRARSAMLDYSFHQIVTDPTDAVLKELPGIVASGIRSFKIFMTYDPLHVDDREVLRVLAAAKRLGAFVTVHCENYAAIGFMTEALIAAGHTAPKYHAWSRPAVVEREATYRAIALAELIDTPIQVFHVSSAEVAEEIARAKARGLKVWGETCPQYLALTDGHMDWPGFEGAKFMCSPAPREAAEHERMWGMIRRGVLDVISSDHCGFSYEGSKGKGQNGRDVPFRDIPNGIPGLAARLPIVFSEGVSKGRITPNEFVALTATNPANLFGLSGKGRIAIGADADLVVWDPKKQVTLTNALMQHAIDYTPYEGIEVTGWPVATIRRGEVVMQGGTVQAEPGSGRFLARGPYPLTAPRGVVANGFDPAG